MLINCCLLLTNNTTHEQEYEYDLTYYTFQSRPPRLWVPEEAAAAAVAAANASAAGIADDNAADTPAAEDRLVW